MARRRRSNYVLKNFLTNGTKATVELCLKKFLTDGTKATVELCLNCGSISLKFWKVLGKVVGHILKAHWILCSRPTTLKIREFKYRPLGNWPLTFKIFRPRTDPERTERTPNGSRMEPERTPNGPRTDPERTPNGPRTDPERIKIFKT